MRTATFPSVRTTPEIREFVESGRKSFHFHRGDSA